VYHSDLLHGMLRFTWVCWPGFRYPAVGLLALRMRLCGENGQGGNNSCISASTNGIVSISTD
jgi:hypothetical protein